MSNKLENLDKCERIHQGELREDHNDATKIGDIGTAVWPLQPIARRPSRCRSLTCRNSWP